MKNSVLFAAGFLFLTSSLANAAPHDFCAHTDIIVPPSGCATAGSDELAAYERGYRNGVFITNYAYDSYGDCIDWDDIADLIDELKAYFGGLTGYDPIDLCRLGGITDAISDRETELLGPSCCCCGFPDCSARGAHEGPQYADTYCMMVVAADFCFDPGVYTRGPVVDQCEHDFEIYCDYYFSDTARDNSACYKYTNNSPPPACLEPFINYRDFICDWTTP